MRPSKLNATDSFMAIMYSLISADGIISDDELADLLRAVQRTAFMRGMTENEFKGTINRLKHHFSNLGPVDFLGLACECLPADLKEGAYIIASDLSYSDGNCSEDERIILNSIRMQLGLSKEFADATQKVITLKNSI